MEDQVWTVKRILDWIEGFLCTHGDKNPKLSAQWLVSEALDVSRIQLFMDPDRPLSMEERDVLRDYTRRRAAGEPLQYITGTTDFRFITVMVEQGVLIPRPETEVLVSEALAQLETANRVKQARRLEAEQVEAAFFQAVVAAANAEGDAVDSAENGVDIAREACQDPCLRVLDLCTGSGCIACSIASEVPYAEVIATDIDPKAVALARRNAQALGLAERVQVIECDLAEGLSEDAQGTFDLLISNPPYIPSEVLSSMDEEVTGFESALALDGGQDGLDLFRRILPVGLQMLGDGGVIALELHETCLDQALEEAVRVGYCNARIACDLAGRQRVLIAQKG
ncbi:MAG: N5-glutamine methyltransferase family protein [Eggerthellaceae bacterium]